MIVVLELCVKFGSSTWHRRTDVVSDVRFVTQINFRLRLSSCEDFHIALMLLLRIKFGANIFVHYGYICQIKDDCRPRFVRGAVRPPAKIRARGVYHWKNFVSFQVIRIWIFLPFTAGLKKSPPKISVFFRCIPKIYRTIVYRHQKAHPSQKWRVLSPLSQPSFH